jgi:hypothetical protein
MSRPSTRIRPESISSRRLMVRMRVDFPDPEGPQITTTSPRSIVSVIPTSAWYFP